MHTKHKCVETLPLFVLQFWVTLLLAGHGGSRYALSSCRLLYETLLPTFTHNTPLCVGVRRCLHVSQQRHNYIFIELNDDMMNCGFL